MVDEFSPPNNSLRGIYLRHRGGMLRSPIQRDIVRKHRAEIVSLIRDDCATLSEVVQVVSAAGEPVLAAGFKKALRREIGTVKAIREMGAEEVRAQHPSAVVPVAPATSPEAAEDFDLDFAARRRRT